MLDLDFWSDAIFGPYVLRCCETLWDVMWCFEMLCSVLRCCVVLWVWSSRVYTGHAHPLPMSQNVIGYLSLLWVWSSVMCPDISWHEACCNTHFHEVSWSLTPLQFVAESWLDVTSDWMYLDHLRYVAMHSRAPACSSMNIFVHELRRLAGTRSCGSLAWLRDLDSSPESMAWASWRMPPCLELRATMALDFLPSWARSLTPRWRNPSWMLNLQRTSGNDGHYRYVLSRWCCAQRVACSLHVLCAFFFFACSLHVLCVFQVSCQRFWSFNIGFNMFAANPTFARIGFRISFDMLKSLRRACDFLPSKT